MKQSELFSVPNPCVRICENTPKGYCKGCFRSRDERFYWHKISIAEQLHIMKLCNRRYRRLQEKPQQMGEQDFEFDEPTPLQLKL